MHLFGLILHSAKRFEDRTIKHGWLSGYSGYPLRPWLLTPVLNPTSPQEVRYNETHMKTRSIVERSFGLLKSRLRCIDTSGGTPLYTPLKCCDIVIVVVVLHNLCIIHHLPLPANDNISLDRGQKSTQKSEVWSESACGSSVVSSARVSVPPPIPSIGVFPNMPTNLSCSAVRCSGGLLPPVFLAPRRLRDAVFFILLE